MRKFCGRFAVLFLLTAALCCVSVFAEELKEGIVSNINLANITVEAVKAGNGDSSLSPETANGKEVYVGSERLTLKLAGAAAGDQNLIIVSKGTGKPTEKNIVYIDQQPGGSGDVTFDVFPKALSQGTYTVWLSNSTSAAAPAGTFEYSAPYLLGDVNGDGNVGGNDATLALRIGANLKSPTELEALAANVNKGGVAGVNSVDALWILQASANVRVLL